MKFEEQFPSLTNLFNKEVDCSDIINTWSEHEISQKVIDRVIITAQEDIQQHCLDKQKVKEIIEDKLISYDNLSSQTQIVARILNRKYRELLKELGLYE